MSNIIPPMVSSSPPPMDDTMEEDEDDEFGDFAAAEEDAPSTPAKLPVMSNTFWEEGCEIKHNGMCNGSAMEEDEEECDRREVERQDNTSQDSVVSGTTDSGLCSASQNSEGASPSPVVDSPPSPTGPDREESSASEETLVRSVDLDSRTCNEVQTETIAVEEGIASTDDFDNFSDFQSVSENVRTESEVRKHLHEEVDEFGEFEGVLDAQDNGFGEFDSIPAVEGNLECVPAAQNSDFGEFDQDSEFEGFESVPTAQNNDFGDFESVSTAYKNDVQSERIPTAQDDDFEDFESAEVHSSASLDHEDFVHRLQTVVTSLFPHGAATLLDVNVSTLDESLTALWLKLKDVESSHALSYQWSGSAANKSLLSALGIDSRNILFGARWNTSVPRFAANLGFSPLEPVRASRCTPAPALEPVAVPTPQLVAQPSTTEQEAVVPAAQFDWNSSGLVNPLDSSEEPSNNALVQGILARPETSSSNELVQQILASSQSTPAPRSRHGLSAEAVKVLNELPELSFLQAKLLMFPVRGTSP